MIDYPVTKIDVFDGYSQTSSEFEYTTVSATYDPSGTVAQYNEVISSTLRDQEEYPYGRTATYFVNGLPDNLTSKTFPGSTLDLTYRLLKGQAYYSATYADVGVNPVSESTVDFNVFYRTLGSLEQASYYRQTSVTEVIDGVSKTSTFTYDANTGLLTQTQTSIYDANGSLDQVYQNNKYWYQEYDPSRALHLLSPVIQSKSTVNGSVKSVTATTWKDWGSGKWAPHKSYIFEGTGGSDFSFASWSGSGEPSSGWLKTTEIGSRTSDGFVKMTKDVDGVYSSVLYDKQYMAPIASFGNARVSETSVGSEASYVGFESNLTTSGIVQNDYWTISSGNAFSTEANTGLLSLKIQGGSPAYGPIRDFCPPDLTGQQRKYILSCWVKTQPGFASGQGWIVLHSKHNSDSDHSLYPNVSGASVAKYIGDTQGSWEYVEIVLDLSSVRQLGGISSGELLRLRAYFANYDPSHYMLVDDIRVSPFEAPFSATSYERKYGLPIGSVGASGQYSRAYYDDFQRTVGSVGNDVVVSGFSAAYLSRSGNSAFSATDPNSSVSVSSNETGWAADFNDGDANGWALTGANWSVQNGALKNIGTSQGDFATRTNANPSIAVRARVSYVTGYEDYGIKIGNVLVRRSGSLWQLINYGNSDAPTFSAGRAKDWLFVIQDKTVLFYADGRMLFAYKNSTVVAGDVQLYTGEPGTEVLFDNILAVSSPSVAMTFADGSGKTMQTQVLDGDSIIVTENVYDVIGRPAVVSKPARVGALFGFRGGFCDFSWTTLSMSGEVASYHSADNGFCYSRTLFDNSPLSRVIERGLPGSEFKIGSNHTVRTGYGKNVAGDGFRDDLPAGKYYEQTITDPNGVVSKVMTDVAGRTISKRSGPITAPGGIMNSQFTVSNEGVALYSADSGNGSNSRQVTAGYTTQSFTAAFTHTASYSYALRGGQYWTGSKWLNTTATFTLRENGNTLVTFSSTGTTAVSDDGTFQAVQGRTYTASISLSNSSSTGFGSATVNYQEVGETPIYPTLSYEYDDAGRLVKTYLPNYYNHPTGNGSAFVITQQYDYLGRLTQKTTPDAGTTKYMYDRAGRLRFMVDANGDAQSPDNIFYYKYDVYGRKIEEGYYATNWSSLTSTLANDPTWPSTPSTWRKKYFYDVPPGGIPSGVEGSVVEGDTRYAKGRLVLVQTNNDSDNDLEVEETFTYDIFGRLMQKTNRVTDFDNQTYATGYEYDFAGNVTKVFYPQSVVSLVNQTLNGTQTLSGDSVFAQDLTINTGSNITMQAANGLRLKAGFNSNGATVSLKAGVGGGGGGYVPSIVTYTYNTLGQLTSIGTPADPDQFASYTYHTTGAIKEEKLNNNAFVSTFTYNSPGWLTGIANSYLTESISYTSGGYGGAGYYNGNISKINYDYSGTSSDYDYSFKYDNLNQLVVADHSGNANGDMGVGQENKYDANGNFWSVKIGLTTKNYTYNANTNRVKNTDGTINTHYTYDNIGNVTQSVPKSVNSLTYDPFVNRTKTITMSSGNNMNFSYDGTERRVYKKDVVGSTTTEILYLHDGMNAIVERNKTGTPTEYIYGPTGIIAIKTTTSMHYVLKDHLGSTRVMVNTTDLPYAITTYDYSAFGTILSTPSSSAYLYTGQEWDQTSGLHNFKARMYDGELGRFYGDDPAGQFASGYVGLGNSPPNGTDPTGEIFGIDDALFWTLVVSGAYVGGSTSNKNWNPTKWDYSSGKTWSGLGIGAASGAFLASGIAVGGAYGTAVGSAAFNTAQGAIFDGAQGTDLLKYAGVGFVTGYFGATGGFGLSGTEKTARALRVGGRLATQIISTGSRSIGNNWANPRIKNKDIFSSFVVGVGPVNLRAGTSHGIKLTARDNVFNILSNGIGLLTDISARIDSRFESGTIEWDWNSLSFNYQNEILRDIHRSFASATGAYSIWNAASNELAEEGGHIWQSRYFNELFLPVYFWNSLIGRLGPHEDWYIGNFFERQAKGLK